MAVGLVELYVQFLLVAARLATVVVAFVLMTAALVSGAAGMS